MIRRTPFNRVWITTSAVCVTAASVFGQDLQVKPPPVPGGVIPLPQGPPVTTQQSPVPQPIKALPPAANPLGWSPDLDALDAKIKDHPLTLQEAIAIALYTNRNFALAAANLQQAQGRTGQARAQLMPTLGVNGQISYYDAPTTASLGKNAPTIVILPQFNPIYTAAFTMPIDIAGTLSAAVSQANFTEVAAKIDVNRIRNQTVFDVKSAFYSALRAQAQVGVATETVNNSLYRLSDANKNYAAGTNSRFDVITAQRDVADAQQTLISAKAQVAVSLAALKNTIGLKVSSRIRISSDGAVLYPPDVPAPSEQTAPPVTGPTTPAPHPTPPPVIVGEQQIQPLKPTTTNEVDDDFDFGPGYTALIDEAMKHRPEILEGDAQIAAAKRGIQFARRSNLPSLSVGLNYLYTPNATAFTRPRVGVAVLNVSLPLFDGGLGRERVREAEGVAAAAVVNRRTAADQVQLDVQSACIALVQARQRVAVANVEVAQAQESFRVSRVRYAAGVSQQVGVSPQIELSNTQISLTQARTNQVNALYDYNTARAQLDRALGRYGAPI